MIIYDFSQLIIANICVQAGKGGFGAELDLNVIRHVALNQLRSIKVKHSSYKNVVIACDGMGYWRRDLFPYYKATRKEKRNALNIPWELVFQSLDELSEELKEFFPYRVIKVHGAEADDIIGTLVKTYYNDDPEGIMIISTDHDFQQLQNYHGVQQYNPVKKGLIKVANPKLFLKEHIIRGDSGDGIPNILSADEVFVTKGMRQKSIMQDKLDVWLTQEPEEFCTTEVMRRNWIRNLELIDLSRIPERISEKIVTSYEEQAGKDRSKLFGYFIKKKLKHLSEAMGEF